MRRPDNDRGRPLAGPASKMSIGDDTVSFARRADNFLHDTLAEVLLAAEGPYWLRRAEALEAARPRPGDFVGASTLEERRERWRRLTAMAKACRARAQISPVADIRDDVCNVLSEVA